MRQVPRIARIAILLVRYRLDELIDAAHLYRPLKLVRLLLPRARADVAGLPRGARLTLALTECGPIFVKFGQILSTRRDLLPADVADELTRLQDQVAPFPAAIARTAVERALGAPLASLYAQFDDVPLASASISQVHAASLAGGREVVVKVLRPDIHARVARDLDLLRAIGELVQRYHPNADKIRPLDVVAEIESTLTRELDLQHEGANASLLRRNFAGSDDLCVPEVVWSHSSSEVLTLERVRGIPVDDLSALDAAGIDRVALAEKGIRLFYTQVFRDNFFHADAHAGNIWVDAERSADPRFIALDFGIMGSLSERDQYWLAENFLALFRRDYRRIAELHISAGWIPPHARLDELETAVRTVCEPYFSRPLSEISLAEVVVKLFQTARRYELVLQPQLILLQKTLLNIEGVGRLLHPGIDIWATAKPVLERIWRKRRSPRQLLRTLRRRAPEWLALAPDMPQLVHEYLTQTTSGGLELRVALDDLKQIQACSRRERRVALWSRIGAALVIAAAVLFALATPVPRLIGVPWAVLAAALGALFAIIMALRSH
ncbi:MAG: ubiquinone biosynthesis regulatory protein kinase UbiB [Rhodanobacteraceae bacterium]